VEATDNNELSFINLDPYKLDVNGGFSYVRLSITVGTAASLIAARLYGLNPRYGIGSQAPAPSA
jgi:hypothetical protein